MVLLEVPVSFVGPVVVTNVNVSVVVVGVNVVIALVVAGIGRVCCVFVVGPVVGIVVIRLLS